jgi:Family of unknown function (DUF6918)
MAATLRDTLLAPDVQPQVVADCEALVNGEVATMSGISGTAVKLAYKAVRTYDAGHIHHMIETLLPHLADALQPYWTDFTAAGGGMFGDYLAKHVKAALPAVGGLVERYAFLYLVSSGDSSV